MSTFTVPPIHRDGWRFVAMFAVATAVLFWMWEPLGWIGVILTCWCAFFFRDPARVTPNRPGLVISPADGMVQMIQPAIPPAELDLMAALAGLRLRERWEGWEREPFTARSRRHVSIYERVESA